MQRSCELSYLRLNELSLTLMESCPLRRPFAVIAIPQSIEFVQTDKIFIHLTFWQVLSAVTTARSFRAFVPIDTDDSTHHWVSLVKSIRGLTDSH